MQVYYSRLASRGIELRDGTVGRSNAGIKLLYIPPLDMASMASHASSLPCTGTISYSLQYKCSSKAGWFLSSQLTILCNHCVCLNCHNVQDGLPSVTYC